MMFHLPGTLNIYQIRQYANDYFLILMSFPFSKRSITFMKVAAAMG
jgi:hypothetical protein